ncbi:hypothetical protein GCM10010442_50170 [Kitasatospora kifunensis]
MKTDLDSLATALHVKTDDLLKDSPQLAPWRPAVGISPQLSDAELVTLPMMQAMLGFTSEARWLRHAHSHLQHLFPHLPRQPGYNKRLRKAAELTLGHTGASAACWPCEAWTARTPKSPLLAAPPRQVGRTPDLPALVIPSRSARRTRRRARGGLRGRTTTQAGPM